jgi:AraC-like DNA-binding protein
MPNSVREQPRDWSGLESPGSFRLVLVQCGRFRSRARVGVADLDRTVGYLGLPAEEEYFAAVRQIVADPPTRGGRRSGDDEMLVDSARAVILADLPEGAGLFTLAELLGVSPYRLSRAFPRVLGVSLTRYRNRVRVGRALDRLEQGEASLATLAADLGFADQAHLSRTIREHLGDTPAALRRVLRSAG